jgi:hypothetical protein
MWTVSAAEKGASAAARKTPSAEPTSASPASSTQADAASRELSEREKALQDWRAKLAGTRWELKMTSTGGSGGQPETDVLEFGQTTLGSDNLLKTGFPHSDNYALYSPTDQSVAWEAMQVKEEKGTHDMAIWRGEVTGETMQGTLVKQRKRGDKETTEQLSFTGRQLEAVPEPTQPAVGESIPAGSPSAPADSPSTGPVEN